MSFSRSPSLDELNIDFVEIPQTPIIMLDETDYSYRPAFLNIAKWGFALIAALPHAANAFMAGDKLMATLENREPESLGNILIHGTTIVSLMSLIVSSTLGLSSEITTGAQAYDFIPRMKDELLLFKYINQSHSTKKILATYASSLLCLSAATINFVITWDTYDTIKDNRLRYPVALITASISFIMTMAVRFVKMKQRIAEASIFYSDEEAFLMELIKELERADHTVHNNIYDLCQDKELVNAFTNQLTIIMEERHITVPERDELEVTVSHMLAKKLADRSVWHFPLRFLNGLYIAACTGMGAIIYGEKLTGLIPRVTGRFALPIDMARMAAGYIGAIPHVATYYVSSCHIADFMHRTWETSRLRTIGFTVLDLMASVSLANVYFSIADNEKKPPTLPLPKQNTSAGVVFAIFSQLAANNINYESCGNKFILPPPSAVGIELQTLKKQIVDEKTVQRHDNYFSAIRSIQSLLFKPTTTKSDLEQPLLDTHEREEIEQKGCLTRLKRCLGW